MNDPYSKGGDPYARGSNSLNDPYSKSNNALTDPYYKRDVFRKDDVFSSNDPYGNKDPYGLKDPYKLDPANAKYDRYSRSTPCQFWFATKEIIQDVFSADVDLHNEKRVFNIDKDLFRLRLLGNIAIKGIVSSIVLFFILTISYFLIILSNPSYKTIILFVDFFTILYVLFCPAHQTYTSAEYTISENTLSFYKIWKNAFLAYQLKILFAILLAIAVAGYFYISPSDLIELFAKIKLNINNESIKVSFLYFSIGLAFIVVFYFLFASYIYKRALGNRVKNYKTNIVQRKQSIAQQYSSVLDEESEEDIDGKI